MRFFTDDYFTKEQKVQMLGGAYETYAKEQQRINEVELSRQLRMREDELEKNKRQKSQHGYDRDVKRIGFAVLLFSLMFVLYDSHSFI